MKEEWCECEGHRNHDFGKLTNFYCRHFLPTGWMFQYTTLTDPKDDRTLYITGKCDRCGGFMRAGAGIADNTTHDKLLWYVCHTMLDYRPFASQDKGGLYLGGLLPRLKWYWDQDQLTKEQRIEQFVTLFHPGADQMIARQWAQKHIPAQPVPRETSRQFFNAVINLVQSNGFWPLSSAFIICEPAFPTLEPETALCHPEFSFIPELKVGRKGELCIDCYLEGVYKHEILRKLLIGSIKTAHVDRDTCIIMGSLTGALLHYGNAYRNANLERYVPYKRFVLPKVQLMSTKGE